MRDRRASATRRDVPFVQSLDGRSEFTEPPRPTFTTASRAIALIEKAGDLDVVFGSAGAEPCSELRAGVQRCLISNTLTS